MTLEVDGLGPVLFCHATPRSDEEMFLESTPAEVVEPMLADAGAGVVVCGHTHMQFDRRVGERAGRQRRQRRHAVRGGAGRVLGAARARTSSCGTPRTTSTRPPSAIRATGWPAAEDFIRENLLVVPTREEAHAAFEPLVGRPRA